jgi:antitoxin Phd
VARIRISDARGRLAEVVTLSGEEAVILERHGKEAAVMISPEQYRVMVDALEEIEDIAAFDAAMAEPGENISWEQARKDLGWD